MSSCNKCFESHTSSFKTPPQPVRSSSFQA